MADQDGAFYCGEEDRLRLERSLFHARWEHIRYFIAPDNVSFLGETSPGISKRLQILDNTAEDACEMAASGLHGLLTNNATRWLNYGLIDDDLAERDGPSRYLDTTSRRTLNAFAFGPSRFNLASYQCYLEAIAFANWCMFVEEKDPGGPTMGLPLFRSIPIVDVVWEEDDDGIVAKVYRRFSRPLWAAYRRFGDKLPRRLRLMHNDRRNHHQRVNFLHCVVPRDDYDPRIPNARNKPWASHWISKDDKEIIDTGGYDEMPYICGRWRVLPNELYGRGCGDKALPDAALLQRGTGAIVDTAEILTQPPFLLPDKGMTKRLNLRRKALNYVRSDYLAQGAKPQPLVTGGDPRISEEFLVAVRDRIQKAFLRDLLQLLRDPEATATQVLKLEEEQMRGMSPILARIYQDWLSPLVMRTFGCLQRAGAFADLDVPREIVGLSPKPVFVSPAARAQQLAEARGIAQGYEAAMAIINADPTVLDNVDLDAEFLTIVKAVGTPLSSIRTPEQAAARKAARQAALEQAQREETIKNVSTGLKNVAPLVAAAKKPNEAQPAAAMAA